MIDRNESTSANQVDVIIVGAGFAGLAAADALVQVSQGGKVPSFVILDAADRLGGRTLTTPNDLLDLGAGYVGATQLYMQQMIQRFGLSTFPTYLDSTKNWLYQKAGGSAPLLLVPGNNPLALPGGQGSTLWMAQLDAMSLVVAANLSAPWDTPGAAEMDAITVKQWAEDLVAKGEMSRETYDLLRVSVRSAFSCELGDISFLFFLYYCASAGSYASLVDVTGGSGAAEGTRFTYGTRSLVDALADAVGRHHIKTGVAVATIAQDESGVDVTMADGTTWRGARVIVAMSPIVSRKIEYQPPLQALPGGPERVLLCDNMPMGHTIKGFVLYKWPFWRAKGLMGYALSTAENAQDAPLDWAMDNSWEPTDWDLEKPAPAHRHGMMTFIVGKAADYWGQQPQEVRAEAVIKHLEVFYGSMARTELIDDAPYYVDMDWSKTASLGCPTGVLGPGIFTKAGPALKRSIGRIHWAGSESADQWCGYMNGAIQSGVRAASEVLRALAGSG